MRIQVSTKWAQLLMGMLLAALLGTVAVEAQDLSGFDEGWRSDAAVLGEAPDPARELVEGPYFQELFESSAPVLEKELNRVYSVDHDWPIGKGRTIRVTEFFSAASWLRKEARAVLFLNGSLNNRHSWNIPVEGYNAVEMVARRGMFAFTVDHVGVGDSYSPADGTAVTFEGNVDAMEKVLKFIRAFRQVKAIDLVGEGYGGALSMVLAADDKRVRSCTVTAMLYDQLNGGPLSDPDFVAFLESAPNGYLFFPPGTFDFFLGEASDGVLQHFDLTQPGFYPTSNLLIAAGELPFFDVSRARAPGLIIFGEQDVVVGPHGMDRLAADYGKSGALLISRPDAGHVPRLERPEIAAWYWDTLFDFIDP